MKRTARKKELDALNREISGGSGDNSYEGRTLTDHESRIIGFLDIEEGNSKVKSRTITPLEADKVRLYESKITKEEDLFFIALEKTTVEFKDGTNIKWENLQVKINDKAYKPYSGKITLSAGDILHAFAQNEYGTATYDSGIDTVDACTIEILGAAECGGNILSLCSPSSYETHDVLFAQLFKNSTGLVTAPSLDIETLSPDEIFYTWAGSHSCYEMFSGCIQLKNVPSIAGTGYNFGAYMFYNCENLKNFGSKFDISGEYACESMFENCTSLESVPKLKHASYYGQYMHAFKNCTNLRAMPKWDSTEIKHMEPKAYEEMYEGCTKLNKIFPLNETTPYEPWGYGESPYAGMFKGCTSLREIPEGFFPLLNLGNIFYYPELYRAMFMGCTSLEKAQNLPYTTLSEYCYAFMFKGCSKLVTAAEMGAEGHYGEVNLAESCCESMYEGCTRLEYAPKLATYGYLPDKCFKAMLKGSGVYAYGEFHIDDDATVGDEAFREMYAYAGRSLRLYGEYPDPPEEEVHATTLLIGDWSTPPSTGVDWCKDMFKDLWQGEEPTLYAYTPFYVNYIR